MILDKVRNTIRRYNLIDKNDRILIGVSGGPDSVILLYLLNRLKKELEINLHIAHLDHRLRKDSYKDREFVQALALRLNLPIISREINVKAQTQGDCLEEIARNVRLNFFFSVAKEIKADKIALGHTQDDQAETVLMRILRGTGLYGLSGILPKRNISGYCIIRPLIEIRRWEIEEFLKKNRISACLDTTNLEDIYFRNKIRNRLLPLLEKEYNQNIKEVLSNMAESAGYDYDYLSRIANLSLNRLSPKTKLVNSRRIILKKFSRLHPAIQRLVLRITVSQVKGNLRRITFQHIKELEDLILNRPLNSTVDLPQGVSARKKKKYLSFYLNPPSPRVG